MVASSALQRNVSWPRRHWCMARLSFVCILLQRWTYMFSNDLPLLPVFGMATSMKQMWYIYYYFVTAEIVCE